MKSVFFVVTLALCLGLASSTSKQPVMTIQSSDGDVIDCIHIREQPAFDDPLMESHVIQFCFSKVGLGNNFKNSDLWFLYASAGLLYILNKTEKRRVWQVWNQNGTSYPDQTICTIIYAIGEVIYLRGVYGAVATMSVWSLSVQQGANEFSLSQVWLVAGQYNGSDLNTLEAGWQVFSDHYLNNQPRLFVYWTPDTYQKRGCLNLECFGFVQVSSQFSLGSAIAPTSSYGGSQFDVTMFIWKNANDGNWWLNIDSSLIGYWPARLFTHLAHGPARLVQWGGEVINSRSYGQHTTTDMGSGHFAEEGFGKASFFRNLKIIDYLSYMQPDWSINIIIKA
ncbi:uncharacterized protein LOC17886418 [Capsella rubella]|uniref:uncharacterized protein LOC17886418 n=1 Tax=Capsella rubella TaxID=81985 RepID=UPI000CD4FCEE|nr:uncharacterized protein LOC17886418 [Capsella rubella]